MLLQLQTQIVRERANADELEKPGDYCYKQIAVATNESSTKMVKTIIINCPYCNRTQHLAYHIVRYYDSWKKNLNELFGQAFNWRPFKNLNGTITVDKPIGCAFNPLHKYSITNNKIQAL
jgi:hypothetical protein